LPASDSVRPSRYIVVVGILAALSSTASAQVTVYTNQASFLAAVQAGYYTESYDSLPPSGTQLPASMPFSQGAFAYTVSATNNATASLYSAGAGTDLWLSTNNTTDVMNYSPTSGNVTAMGGFFFGSDIAGNFQQASITVQVNGGSPQTFSAPSPTNGAFIGFTSTSPFTLLTVAADQSAGTRWPTVNDFTVGIAQTVPEPTSLALLGIPALGLAWKRRRAKAAK
jgi:hypothetical protein